jgi:hypothetical protein
MKNSIIIHALWLAIAIGAFATGWSIKPGSDGNGGDKNSSLQVNVNGGNPLSGLGAGSAKAGTKGQGAAQAGNINAATGKSTSQLIDDFLNSNDPLEQNFLFAQMLMGLTADNAPGMFESLKGKLRGRDGGRQMTLFFQAWGKIDGAAAIAAATAGNEEREEGRGRGGPGGPGGGFNVMSVLAGWVATDTDAAMQWLSGVEDERAKGFYTYGLVGGLAKTDAAAATNYVIELAAAREAARAAATAAGEEGEQRRTPYGDPTQRYINQIADEQIKQGMDTAVAWANDLPDGDLKSAAFDQVAESYVRSDIDAAKEWVAKYAEEDYARRAVGEVAEQLAREDPQSAIDWASSLPENAQGSAYSEAMERWTQKDATAASEFLATMEPSDARDSAVSSFARELDREDPQSAATWAATITDEGARTETLSQVARSWMRSDADAAKAWLPESGLPADTQTQIMENPGRGRGGFDFRGRGGGGPGGGR